MAEFNRNQNGVFGEVKFEGNNNVTENTSYFEGTIPGANLANEQNNGKQSEQAGNIFGSFGTSDNGVDFQPIGREKAITKQGLWSKVKAFLFQEIDLNAQIKVELITYQQKVEDEINEFLHQEITFKGIANFFKGNK